MVEDSVSNAPHPFLDCDHPDQHSVPRRVHGASIWPPHIPVFRIEPTTHICSTGSAIDCWSDSNARQSRVTLRPLGVQFRNGTGTPSVTSTTLARRLVASSHNWGIQRGSGIVVPEILGSRSTDTMSGIGPTPREPDVVLPIGPSPTAFSLIDLAPVPPMTNETLGIRVVFGPRAM